MDRKSAQRPAPLAAVELARRQPVRLRGKSSRARLIAAAQCVFARLGFIDTRVADIVNEAGVAHGTFYTYFDSKEEILRHIADEVFGHMFAALKHDAPADNGGVEWVIKANHRYVEVYEHNVAMIAVIEQVATFNDDFRQMRLALRRQHEAYIERAIRRIYREPLAKRKGVPQIDPHVAASALGGMIDNFLYLWFVLKEPFVRETALKTLDEIWLRALGLSVNS